MTYSMTAFAREQARTGHMSLSWELRSVNQRYLDSSFRLPEEFRDLEHQLQNLLKEKISRGKVDCTLKTAGPGQANYEISLNQNVLKALTAAFEKLKQTLPVIEKVNPMELLKWPGVVEDMPVRGDEVTAVAISSFKLALDSLISMRKTEGEALKTVVLSHLDKLAAIVTELQGSAPDIARRLQEKVTSKLQELDVAVDKSRLEQEVVFLAQKADVQEELDRLISHIREIKSTFDSSHPIGRRLDFLMQELNREANTLASKSTLADTSLKVVEIKVLIEQMREQIQNIE